MKEKFKGVNKLGDELGLSEERKEDLQDIMTDRLILGLSTREALERAIERKRLRKSIEEAGK